MNEFQEKIIKLAETYKEPNDFILNLEANLKPPEHERGNFFLEVGTLLYQYSYIFLALHLWEQALECFTRADFINGKLVCHVNLGTAYYDLKDYPRAIESYEKSLKIAYGIGDKASEASCYRALGNTYESAGDYQEAIKCYGKVLQISADKSEIGRCYRDLGIAQSNVRDYKTAIDCYERSVEILALIGDRDEEAKCFVNLGNAYDSLADHTKAGMYYERALDIAKSRGHKDLESICYRNLGLASSHLKDYKQAVVYHEKALAIVQEDLKDRLRELECYKDLGDAYFCLNNCEKAIVYYEYALKIGKEIGVSTVTVNYNRNMGRCYDKLGDFRKAIQHFGKLLEIGVNNGDDPVVREACINLGIGHSKTGNFRMAIDYYKKALETKKEVAEGEEAACFSNLGIAYVNLGEFRKAIEYFEKSLEIIKSMANRDAESDCYVNLGNAYLELGDSDRAIEYEEMALGIAKNIGDRATEMMCYSSLGIAYDKFGNGMKALDCHEKSLAIAKESRDRIAEFKCYGNLGNVYARLGDFTKANEYNEKALDFARGLGDRSMESRCHVSLGYICLRMDHAVEAVKHYEEALRITEEIGDLAYERIINNGLGIIHYHLHRKEDYAHNYLKRSIELSEIIGKGLVEEEHKISFYGLSSDAYQFMVPLCVDLEKGEEAFQYAERSRGKAFIDMLAATEVRPSGKLIEQKSLLGEEEVYLDGLREFQMRHLRETRISTPLGKVEELSRKLNEIHDEMEKIDPEYVSMRRGRPPSLDHIKGAITSDRRRTVLVEYFITKDEVFIFLVSINGLHIARVSLPEEKLLRYIDAYRREVHSFQGAIGDTWLELSSYLIEPVSESLTKSDLIYFIPYGALHYIPMHALELNGEPLIKNHPVCYSPAASMIRFCQNKGTDRLEDCASFGVVFEDEAKAVAELFKTKPYLGKTANKRRVTDEAKKDVIHLSCHGYFDNQDPLSSGVLLYNDEVLTAKEIFNMRINTELVTLSACQTGLNERRPGDELIGLTRAFLYAGAASVVVSLWSVDVRSTQELMLEFYSLLRSGRDKATALQEAQKEIMEKEEYSHPYYWAPFILVGDWK